jgi:hypothetical protein
MASRNARDGEFRIRMAIELNIGSSTATTTGLNPLTHHDHFTGKRGSFRV